jgi:hypothetical protein
MEKHPGTRRNHLILALVAGGMLLAGVFFLRAGASGFAEAATPAAGAPAPPSYTCRPLVKVLVSLNYKEFVNPKNFTICQDHGPKGHYRLMWEKAPGAQFSTFSAVFTPDQDGNCPFVDAQGHDQCSFSFAQGQPSLTTPGHTKFLGLKPGQTRYFKYKVTICTDAAETHCQDRDPGGIIQP